jgi:predicted O-linked N-acetylglucosamine transferase (SPINDLY family)
VSDIRNEACDNALVDLSAVEATVQQALAQRDPERALTALAQLPATTPPDPRWAVLRGRALRQLGQAEAALVCFDEALALDPRHASAWEGRGNTLLALGQPEQALYCYDQVLADEPGRLDSRFNRGLAALRLHRPAEALATFDLVLQAEPNDVEALINRGNALLDLRRLAEAEASQSAALRLQPDHPEALHNLGVVRQELHQPQRAAEAFEQMARIAPGHLQVEGKLLHANMQACDWRGITPLLTRIEAGLQAGQALADPFTYQGIASDPALQRRCAELAAAQQARDTGAPLPPAPAWRHPRLRIGYVSGEFRQQATSVLMAEVFELHDRTRFEVHAFDNGWDDGSPLRRRLVSAFDSMVDISGCSDRDAAAQIRAREIDVLVDLNVYFGRARPGVFALRPSPVQVNYLGFPGTSGAPWMDYLIADRHIVPPEDADHYTERIVRVAGCYQANDSRRRVEVDPGTRSAHGLPDHGFVFCCFNNNYKLTPAVFAVWMSLLRQLPGSVLWLLKDNADAARNLQGQATRQGVDPQRLVFAPRVGLKQHLARHLLADLFLDTLPCNAHTTASDALHAGLPVLTCTGRTFSGRVAGSLLHHVRLPELVTADLGAYEAQALRLARDPAVLAALRDRLRGTAAAGELFDTPALCRQLEAAYTRMVRRAEAGLAPEAFDVTT